MTHPAPAGDGDVLPARPARPAPDMVDGTPPVGQGVQWLRLLPAVLDDDPYDYVELSRLRAPATYRGC